MRSRHLGVTELEKISRVLAAILRHKAPERGIHVRPDGFMSVSEVLRHVRCADLQSLKAVVRSSLHHDGTPRFELQGADSLIRATRGHSFHRGASFPNARERKANRYDF